MRLLVTLAWLLALLPARSAEPAASSIHSFWFWNRVGNVQPSSIAEMQRLGIDRLYLHFQELDPRGTWVDLNSSLPGKTTFPNLHAVIRIAPDPKWIDDPNGLAIIPSMSGYEHLGAEEARPALQIDFDCPASRLADYAAAITRLRETGKFPPISITALASWIDAPDFPKLAAAADELVPMFYDLEADAPDAVRRADFEPMISPDTLRWIAKWKNCPKPWRAGLPNFQRLTTFAEDGSLVGHHPRFRPEFLFDHPLLELREPGDSATSIFDVSGDGTVSLQKVSAGQVLVWRRPDDTLLRSAVTLAMENGAQGIVWFAHPDSAPTAWHRVPHLCQFLPGNAALAKPLFEVHTDSTGILVLRNTGSTDLTPRADGKPWELVLEGDPGSFDRADPGAFHSLEAIGSSNHRLELARGVRLRFVQLPAGTRLASGMKLLRTNTPPPWSIHPAP